MKSTCTGVTRMLFWHLIILFDTLDIFTSSSDIQFLIRSYSMMVRLTEVQRGEAIAMVLQGQCHSDVARHFGVNVCTIDRLVRRLRETGQLADRPRSGRPRVTSQRQDRFICLSHFRNRHLTATETADLLHSVTFHPPL